MLDGSQILIPTTPAFETVDAWYNLDTGQTTGLNGRTTGRTAFEWGFGEKDSLASPPSMAVFPVGDPFIPVVLSRI
jgi:hypothetical protein